MTTLRYDFSVVGLEKVNRALQSIERRFAQHNRNVDRTLGTPTKYRSGGGRAADPNRAERDALLRSKRLNSEFDRIQKQQARLFERIERQKTRVAEQESRARIRAAEREARARDKALIGRAGSSFRGQLSGISGDFNRRLRELKTEAAARRRLARQTETETLRQSRAAEAQAIRQSRLAETQARRNRSSQVRRAGRISSSVTDSLTGNVGYFGRYAGLIAGLSGAAFVGRAVGESARAQKESVVLGNIAASNPREKRSAGVAASSVFQSAKTFAGTTGIDKLEIIEALRNITGKSGRLSVGQAVLPDVLNVSQAYGAATGDVANTIGTLLLALDTFHPNLSDAEAIDELRKSLSLLVGQANLGSVEFSDLAQQTGKLVAATSGFEGSLSDKIGQAGVGLQLAAVGGASDAAEAGTAILRFRDDLGKLVNKDVFKQDKYKDVQLFKDKDETILNDPGVIIADLLRANKGSIPDEVKIFGERGRKAFEPFRRIYTNAGGGEAGEAALKDIRDKFLNAKVSTGQIGKDANRVRQTDLGKFQIAVEQLQNSISTGLLPAVTALVPKIQMLVPHIAKAADFFGILLQKFADDPVGSIITALKFKLLADLGSAAIGSAVSAALTRVILAAGLAGGGRVPIPIGGVPIPSSTSLGGPIPVGGALGGGVASKVGGKLDKAKAIAGKTAGAAIVAAIGLGIADSIVDVASVERDIELTKQGRDVLSSAENTALGGGKKEDKIIAINEQIKAQQKFYDSQNDGFKNWLFGLKEVTDVEIKVMDALSEFKNNLLEKEEKPFSNEGLRVNGLYERGMSEPAKEMALEGIGAGGLSPIMGGQGIIPNAVNSKELLNLQGEHNDKLKKTNIELGEFSINISSLNKQLEGFKINRGNSPSDPTESR